MLPSYESKLGVGNRGVGMFSGFGGGGGMAKPKSLLRGAAGVAGSLASIGSRYDSNLG